MIQITSEIPVTLIQQVGGDAMIVAAARVSTSGEEARAFLDADPEDNYGLIKYLINHRHGSPFEHGLLTFFVHAPLFVFREWMRHRIASYNEESGRYKTLDPLFWTPRRERPIAIGPDYKPARPVFEEGSEAQCALIALNDQAIYAAAYRAYRAELDLGIGPEVARRLLPLAIYSSAWVTVNPRGLMNFLSLRTHEPEARFTSYPQAEIEEAARICEAAFAEHWPLTYRAFNANGRFAP